MIDNYKPAQVMPVQINSDQNEYWSCCRVCRQKIDVGTLAQKHKSGGWKHAACQPKTAKDLNAAMSEDEIRKVGHRQHRRHGRVVRGLNSL